MPNVEPVDEEVDREEDYEDNAEEDPYYGDDAMHDYYKDRALE